MKNILAEATIDEDFPKDFGIYDLNQFLNGVSLHQSAELDFQNDSYVVIREGRSRSKYFFADPNVIVTPPEKSIALPSEDVCFTLDTKELDKLLKAAAVYQLPDLSPLVKQALLNWLFVTRRTIPLMTSPLLLVKLTLSSSLTSKLRTSRFFLAPMML